jgi:hypothetical protein
MSNSLKYKLFIATLVLVTVAWKTAIPSDTSDDLELRFAAFFSKNGFKMVTTEEFVNNFPIIQANRDACNLSIAKVTPDGSNQDLIQTKFSTAVQTFFVFKGRVYKTQPTFLTVFEYLRSRFLRELGFVNHVTPIFAVGVNSTCDAENLPWRDLYD